MSSSQLGIFASRGLCLPSDNATNTLIKRFIATAVGKIHKLRREKLHELEAPWITKKVTHVEQLYIMQQYVCRFCKIY